MADQFAMSFGVLNYSGMLFNKGNTRTPLSSIIGGRAKTTNHVEFVTGQEYTTGGGEQPSISECFSDRSRSHRCYPYPEDQCDSDFSGVCGHFLREDV